MRGRLSDLNIGLNGKHRITIEIDKDFRDDYDRLQGVDVTIEIKRYRPRRSLTANAYFHLLLNKIAEQQGLGSEEIKKNLVCEYGPLAKDAEGHTVGFKLPASVDVGSIYPYVKCFDTREENGKLFNCYLVYKQTHLMDSGEMARLIDGTINDARELGIETDTPEQLARFKQEWDKPITRKKENEDA
jgi:hypothetical protein